MRFRDQAVTVLAVTVVSILIWMWAAGATLERTTLSLRIHPSGEGLGEEEWVFSPEDYTVDVELEGSAFALEEARALDSRRWLYLGQELPASSGVHTLWVVDLLRQHEALRKTGVNVVAATPSSLEMKIDKIVEVKAPVQPRLPSFLQIDGEVTVTPREVEVSLPEELARLVGTIVVEAAVEPSRVDDTQQGRLQKLTAALRVPELAGDRHVSIEPSTATVEFTVRSRTRETTLSTVAVQIAIPPTTSNEFIVTVDEKDSVLHDVTVRAEDALIQKIRGGMPVIALVHLSGAEQERGIESKRVTGFLALPVDGPGIMVDAMVGGKAEPPLIRFKITPRK